MNDTPQTPTFDADGNVIGDTSVIPAEIVVTEFVKSGMTGSATMDLALAPPTQQLEGEIARLDAPVNLDIERPPGNKRILPNDFYSERARPIRLTQISAAMLITFLDQLEKTGLWEMSATRAGLTKRVVHKLKKLDADFNEACNLAMSKYVDEVERKIVERAVDGWEEPQFSHKTGIQVGSVRRFDSRLAELVIKRHKPEYREKFEGEMKVTGGVIVVPMRPASTEDFFKTHQMIEGETVPTPEAPKQ